MKEKIDIQSIKKRISDLKLKQKVTTDSTEWGDLQTEIEKLYKQLNNMHLKNKDGK